MEFERISTERGSGDGSNLLGANFGRGLPRFRSLPRVKSRGLLAMTISLVTKKRDYNDE